MALYHFLLVLHEINLLILFDEGKALKTPKKEKMKMTTTMKRTISLRYVPSHLINANPKLPKVRSKRKNKPQSPSTHTSKR